MHIRQMVELVQRETPDNSSIVDSPAQSLPVEMSVTLEEPVWRRNQVLDAVKIVKATPWYRIMKRSGLQFVPLDCRDGMLILAVGTAQSLGAVYLHYMNEKLRSMPAQASVAPACGENRKAN
jgi:hypothetical protein